eukprot:COSAG04_NODE_1688_length_5939_cov_3.958048_1_plen_92_part_00
MAAASLAAASLRAARPRCIASMDASLADGPAAWLRSQPPACSQHVCCSPLMSPAAAFQVMRLARAFFVVGRVADPFSSFFFLDSAASNFCA